MEERKVSGSQIDIDSRDRARDIQASVRFLEYLPASKAKRLIRRDFDKSISIKLCRRLSELNFENVQGRKLKFVLTFRYAAFLTFLICILSKIIGTHEKRGS